MQHNIIGLQDKDKTQLQVYELDPYHRSNQDTSLLHRSAINAGEWVESGDLLADNSSSYQGELAIGKNILVAYMPWEGYNYEDSILINERLVYDDAYTSVHIERYEIEVRESQQGSDRITKEIPDLPISATEHLDSSGIAKIGSWVEEGDILVGKVTPINPKKQTGYQRLIYKLFDKKAYSVRDSSLRAPKGIKANVINVQILDYLEVGVNTKLRANSPVKTDRRSVLTANEPLTSYSDIAEAKQLAPQTISILQDQMTSDPQFNLNFGTTHSQTNLTKLMEKWSKAKKPSPPDLGYKSLSKKSKTGPRRSLWAKNLLGHSTVKGSLKNCYRQNIFVEESRISPIEFSKMIEIKNVSRDQFDIKSSNLDSTTLDKATQSRVSFDLRETTSQIRESKDIPKDFVPTNVQIYLAEKRKIQVGDKMAGRHGNKGIISNILPRQDMPYLPDGTPLDIVLNPLGVPSRMNVGQIYECLLGLAGKYLGEHYKVFPFDEIYGPEASRSFVFSKLFEARKKTGIEWIFDPNSPGKIRIFDGRTSESFDQPVTVGIAYMLKLVHMVDDKIHMRSTGPYSLVTQQPLRGRAKHGGQRLGEMEVWAIEGYGAAFVLLEMLTLKSDDMTGRLKLWSDVVLNKDIRLGTPESFKVLVCELQALCLDIGLYSGRRSDFKQEQLAKKSSQGAGGLLKDGSRPRQNLKEISHLMFMP